MHFSRLRRKKLRCDPVHCKGDLKSDLIPREQISVERNQLVPARRAFVLQGNGPVSLVHMPYIGASSQRQQCILNGELSCVGLKAYAEAKRADPTATFVACTLKGEDLSTIIRRRSLKCMICKLTAKGYVIVQVAAGETDVIDLQAKRCVGGTDYRDHRPQIPATYFSLSRPSLSIKYALLPLRYNTRNAHRSRSPSGSKCSAFCRRSNR